MRPHKALNIWEEAMKLITEIYETTAEFPREETYGLVNQMKRSAVSIASNIAEGCARRGDQEKIRFFVMSRGSLSELDAQLEISLRLKFVKKPEYDKLMDRLERVSRMLQGLINSRLPNHSIAR